MVLTGCDGSIGDGPLGDAPEIESTTSGGGGHGGEVNSAVGVGGTGGGGAAQAGSGGAGGGGGEVAAWQPVETNWCTKGWLGLDERTCFFAPESLASPPTILFFLHGMMPSDASPAAMQAIAKQAAEAHGFVAVFPRGEQGLCSWDASVMDWYCWPTSRKTVDTSSAALIEAWGESEALLEGVLGVAFKRRYVLGFSNGGYYAAYIGLEGLLKADGVGVVAAGRSFVDESLMPPTSTPFYIAVGDLDTAAVKSSAGNLASVLDAHTWPNDHVVHGNRGHEIRADDFDGAAAIWGWP
jgi:poly(3-hydroxybutyrate) depolymerase